MDANSTKNNTPTDNIFDFIVIGAGTAGACC